MAATKYEEFMQPAVLFINALWTEQYDGTEKPMGNFAYFKTEKYAKYGASDELLFTADGDGIHYCGLGQGAINVHKLDAVFVARDPRDHKHNWTYWPSGRAGRLLV